MYRAMIVGRCSNGRDRIVLFDKNSFRPVIISSNNEKTSNLWLFAI